MNYRLNFLIVSLILTIGCSSNKGDKHIVSMAETSSVKRIVVDANTNCMSENICYYEDSLGGEYITILDKLSNSIDYYRLDSCVFSHRLTIDLQKNNLTELLSHGITERGELFVTTIMPPLLCKIDSKGDVLEKYELNSADSVAQTFLNVNYTSSNYLPIVIEESKVYCPIDFETYSLWEENFEQIPLSMAIDTTTGVVKRLPLNYPIMFNKEERGVHICSHSRIFDGERFVYSFGALSDLYVTQDFKAFEKYTAESIYLKQVNNKPFHGASATPYEYGNYLFCRAEYGNILYDMYRELYYRFCYLESQEAEGINGNNYLEYCLSKGRFSIQIFDKKLNMLGETLFESKRFAPRIFFLNESGLWLSENNVERDDFCDDTLIFRCLKIEYESN
ncbi:MAG: DUF4221 family protein [Marinilabiliaceae bacterium]|nr:DUF4221 family protein [Marinilabiliaceae bacterium]